jgi:hypothetical protein
MHSPLVTPPEPIKSWIGSLRPNATSLRAPAELGSKAAAHVSHPKRRRLVIAGVVACVAVVGAASWPLRGPRSGLPVVQNIVSGRAGLRVTPSGADERWMHGPVTVTIDPTLARATPVAKEAILNAFGAWASSGAYLPQIVFNATSTPGQAAQDGVNLLLLGPITQPGDETYLAITISYALESTGEIVEADTIFNDAYDWASIDAAADGEPVECGARYDLQNVATHEAGHFFGLGEDYSDETTTMYVSSKLCQTSKRELSLPDVSAVSGLYAGGMTKASSCGVAAPGARP